MILLRRDDGTLYAVPSELMSELESYRLSNPDAQDVESAEIDLQSAQPSLEEFVRAHISRVFRAAGGDIDMAASVLGVGAAELLKHMPGRINGLH